MNVIHFMLHCPKYYMCRCYGVTYLTSVNTTVTGNAHVTSYRYYVVYKVVYNVTVRQCVITDGGNT